MYSKLALWMEYSSADLDKHQRYWRQTPVYFSSAASRQEYFLLETLESAKFLPSSAKAGASISIIQDDSDELADHLTMLWPASQRLQVEQSERALRRLDPVRSR